MSKAALAQLLGRCAGSHECDPDSSYLARFLAERDQGAFAALVQRHGPLVYGTCLRVLGNRTDTDDAFQAVFFVLARRAHVLKRDRSIGPWLHGVALRVAKKLRGQTVRRRLREMSAARSERVEPAEPDHDFWAVIDEELARLALPLREVLLLCDLSGQSHSRTAASLGLAKGTVTKRLAKAREELATRLKRRGITLGVGALSVLIATRAPASVPAPLLLETARRAVAFSVGQVGGSLTAKTLAEAVMRSPRLGVVKVGLVVGLLGLVLTGGGLMLAGGPADPDEKGAEQPPARAGAKPDAKPGTMWKENFTGEHESSLPVSIAFSADGKTLLIGDTKGEVMAVKYASDPPTYRWKSNVGGSHAAVTYSADPGQKKVYATSADGVRILDAATGKEEALIEAKDSDPVAIGVFPDNHDAKYPQMQIVFGNARGYFVKSWSAWGKPADTMRTLDPSTVAKDAKPADVAAVPLAVDPRGRSAIMTGPRDAKTNKNVLWAYVCGDHAEGGPGNRVMVGHAATVVSAAWAKADWRIKEGGTAVTGDADGRVIVWDAKTMKEARRVELGGRVMALAITDDGTHVAAYLRGKQGADLYVWEAAKPAGAMRPIYTQPGDFSSEPYASLAFSPDGKQLAGCAIDKNWLRPGPNPLPTGQVHGWVLAPEPKAQPAPLAVYTKPLPKGSSANFVVLNNYTILTAAAKEGAIDFRDIRDGGIQARLVLGKFAVGRMKLSSDRKWLAVEQHPLDGNVPTETFDVGVYDAMVNKPSTIPSCGQLLDVASGGKVVAVVRDKQIELWDAAAAKKLKAAPFKHTRIDAAQFSPDGKLLAVSDRNELVLWRWEEDKHERIDLGRCVGSLVFTPDGKFLAEGPTPRENIQVRDVTTRKVVQTLANGTKQSMNVPRMTYTQGGRVLIACDNITLAKEVAVPHRITLWDTASGSIAHQIALPSGLPSGIDVSPNGKYLAAVLDDGDAGMKMAVWRLDGEKPLTEPANPPPASDRPR
jgi:RNA polymerase sigma factor (sigma-70 family)